MTCYFSLLFVLSASVLVFSELAYEDDEYYCQNNKESKICHRCPDLDTDCSRKMDEDCRCDNIAINNENERKFLGSPKCDTYDDYGEPYCYVREDSACKDLEEDWSKDDFASNRALESAAVWFKGDIYRSYVACNKDDDISGNDKVLGNEEVLEGFEIISTENDTLKVPKENMEYEPLRFNFSDPGYENWKQSEDFKVNYTKWLNDDKNGIEYIYTHCEWQCANRNNEKSVCGAWSFDTVNEICHLFYVTACCGQKENYKRRSNKLFVSGYVCPHCWSTRNGCSCSIKDLEKQAVNTAFAAGDDGTGGISHSSWGGRK